MGNVASHDFQLMSVAGLDDDRDSFIRADVFCTLVGAIDRRILAAR
jgi:hypothetical protein